jgi:hypothetical protein
MTNLHNFASQKHLLATPINLWPYKQHTKCNHSIIFPQSLMLKKNQCELNVLLQTVENLSNFTQFEPFGPKTIPE